MILSQRLTIYRRNSSSYSLVSSHSTGEFFTTATTPDKGGPHQQLFEHQQHVQPGTTAPDGRVRQNSHPERTRQNSQNRRRVKQDSFMQGVLRRKQVSLDLLGANDFFDPPQEMEETMDIQPVVCEESEDIPEGDEKVLSTANAAEEEQQVAAKGSSLFLPLRFAPRVVATGQRKGVHGGHGSSPAHAVAAIDEETCDAFMRYSKAHDDLHQEIVSLKQKMGTTAEFSTVSEVHNKILEKQEAIKEDERLLRRKLTSGPDSDEDRKEKEDYKEFNDDDIIRAGRSDYIKAIIIAVMMLAITISLSTWTTHVDEESYIFDPVGLACVTPCEGNLEYRDFFHGHNHFEKNEVIDLILHVDGYEEAALQEVELFVEIIGVESGEVKSTTTISPLQGERKTFEETVTVDFLDPHEHHIINVSCSDGEYDISFTLSAHVLKPLADHSEIVAALIMIAVYFFILIEVVHRTLVAIFGSMVAGMFLFAMHDGNTESIAQLMLHLDWLTLGLLFGMMLLVGELSHTGIFEWCAVRLLMASKGSFKRLMILLCCLTAVASAFLDNVTTMLLIAPVTIDMCSILEVDPRPYLIGEVILSNIGGTATLIGE